MAKQPTKLLAAENVAEAARVLTKLADLRAKMALYRAHVGDAHVVTVSVDHPGAAQPMVFVIDPYTLHDDMAEEDAELCRTLAALGVEPPERPLPAQPALSGLVAEAAEAEAPAHA